jgi:hypothetical protein
VPVNKPATATGLLRSLPSAQTALPCQRDALHPAVYAKAGESHAAAEAETQTCAVSS